TPADARRDIRTIEPNIRKRHAQVAGLSRANLARSRLSGIIAVKTDLSGAVMKDCKLVRANLKQANLNGADLAGADMTGADLSGADLRDAVLVGVKSDHWRADGANMEGALTDKKPAGEAVTNMPAAEMLRDHALWCESGGAAG